MSISVMTTVWNYSKNKGSRLLLLLAIADFAHEDGAGAWPSINTLAKKTRQTERNTQLLLKDLEDSKELTIETGKGPNGCNLYTINLGILLGGEKISPSPRGVKSSAEGVKTSAENARRISPDPLYNHHNNHNNNIVSAGASSPLEVPVLKEEDLFPEDGVIPLSGERVGSSRVKAVPPPTRAPTSGAAPKPRKVVDAKALTMQQAMVGALAQVTQQDPNTCATKLAKSASNLIKAGYTPDQIKTLYGLTGWWFKNDWRGQKGHIPTIHGINETILQAARNINPANARSVAKAVAHADAPVLTAEDKEQLRVDEQVTFWERHFKICAENITQGVITTLLKKDPNVGARFKHLLKAESSNAKSQEDSGSVND